MTLCKKIKNPNPARNCWVPSKIISKRRVQKKKSRGSPSTLKVWQKSTQRRNWRQHSNLKPGDHLCSQNLNCHMASDTLWNRSKACLEQIKKCGIFLFRLRLWFSSFPPRPDRTPCSLSPSTFCWSKLPVGRNSINLALYLPLEEGNDQGRDAGDQISFISTAAIIR